MIHQSCSSSHHFPGRAWSVGAPGGHFCIGPKNCTTLRSQNQGAASIHNTYIPISIFIRLFIFIVTCVFIYAYYNIYIYVYIYSIENLGCRWVYFYVKRIRWKPVHVVWFHMISMRFPVLCQIQSINLMDSWRAWMSTQSLGAPQLWPIAATLW